MISAFEAKKGSDKVWELRNDKNYAWEILNKSIEKAIKFGQYMVVFEETEYCRFYEDRKNVKEKLENMGYKVEYKRYRVVNYKKTDIPNEYLNIYTISWGK